MSGTRAFGRVTLAALTAVLLAALSMVPGSVAPVAAATDWAEFGTPTAEASFDQGVSFSQPVTIDREVRRVELLVSFAGATGPTVIPVAGPSGNGAATLTYRLDPSADGHIAPNTPMTARWRLVGADDPADVAIGPEVRITYADDRFDWRTEAGELVRVHWYEGSAAFGARALQIGEDAVREAAELLQVDETDPVDFYVYADQDAFYDALGPGTRENVGGQANSEIRTMFALIPADEIDDAWVGQVIPHELAHLVFDTAASNPYHFPPRWLNEGLAVYLSQGYDASDRGAVEGAAGAGTLIPLDGITGQFPTSFERFALAYAESVSAVDYLIRTHGQDPLVTLIRSYAEGRTDDQAFEAALGQDVATFGAGWLDDLGAAPPTRFGPQPAPEGPIPSAWLGGAAASALPAASGAATSGPDAAPPSGEGAADGSGPIVLVVLVGAIALVVIVIVARRRRVPGGPPG
jgi:hypothetical protein